MASKKFNLSDLRETQITWSIPLLSYVDDKNNLFIKRRKAVDMYIAGEKLEHIETVTQIKKANINHLVEKCLSYDENGNMLGYSALLPGPRDSGKKNIASNTTRGLFEQLLATYPELEDYIIGNYTGNVKYTLEKTMTISTLHKRFLLKCHDLGLSDNDYPFNTANQGERSLRRFIKDYENKHINVISARESKDAKQKLLSTGYGEKCNQNAVMPYACVQVDGHIIDLIYTTEVELNDGRLVSLPCSRCWLFAVIDVATRVVIGYSLSQELNYNQYDVLHAIQNSILPHKQINFSIPNLSYPENGGFPSTAFPQLNYALIDEIMLDNAKSHLANNVVTKLIHDTGAVVNFGSVATPETRGIVERLFSSLEKRGFHQVPATTGGSATDVKRKSPEASAIKYKITFDDITELTEALIAEYNTTPHTSLYGRTPIEELESKLEFGMMPEIANEAYKKRINELMFITREATVRGNKAAGKRPYIQFMGAQYRNPVLSSDFSFVSKKLLLKINPDDISQVEAFLLDGTSIGILKANGEFGTKSHSLKSRKLINKMVSDKRSPSNRFATPITTFETLLKERAVKDKKARTRLDIMHRESPEKKTISKTENLFNEDVRLSQITSHGISHESVAGLSAEEIYNLVKGKEGDNQC